MRGLLICLFFCLAGPALADTTAVYETPAANFRMTLEIAASGDVRGDVAGQPDVYILTLDGHGYFIIKTSSGVVVERIEDTLAALKVVAERRLGPEFLEMMKDVANSPELASIGNLLTKGEDIVVRGRKGTPYYFSSRGGPGVSPVIVISSDPELAPLGVAIAGQMAMTNSLQFGANPLSREIEAIMKSGAPISFAGTELTTVSHEPIPPARFELPAPPQSLEDIIKRIEARATDQRITAF